MVKTRNLTVQTQMSRFDWTSRVVRLVEAGTGKCTVQVSRWGIAGQDRRAAAEEVQSMKQLIVNLLYLCKYRYCVENDRQIAEGGAVE